MNEITFMFTDLFYYTIVNKSMVIGVNFFVVSVLLRQNLTVC